MVGSARLQSTYHTATKVRNGEARVLALGYGCALDSVAWNAVLNVGGKGNGYGYRVCATVDSDCNRRAGHHAEQPAEHVIAMIPTPMTHKHQHQHQHQQ